MASADPKTQPPAETQADAAAGAATAAAPKKSKKRGMLVTGSVVVPVALAWMLSMLAIPKKKAEVSHRLTGPFIAHVSPSNGFQVNLADRGSKHYLAMNMKVGVEAYEESYVNARSNDALHQARLSDAVLKVASKKSKDDLDGAVEKDEFREELRLAIDSVLFPVHVGNEGREDGAHAASGLRGGASATRATFRGLFHEHVLHVDATARTIQLDGGPAARYSGQETDLRVDDASGRCVFLDVRDLHEGFRGEVHVGVLGRVREVYFSSFLTQ